MANANRIGWKLVSAAFVIVAGSSGAWQFSAEVLQSDGSALPSYDGWTCLLKLYGPQPGAASVVTMTPDVTGDPTAHTLTFNLAFAPADTIDLAPGVYEGVVWLTDPTDGAKYAEATVTLTVESRI